jgi:protein O-mannosyl-transferase
MAQRTRNAKLPDRRSAGRHERSPRGPRGSAFSAAACRTYATRWAIYALLILAVALVYGQTVTHDFVNMDDSTYVYTNQHVQAGLTSAEIVWAFTQAEVSGQWSPLTLLSLMADVQMVKPAGGPPDRFQLAAEMHAVNLALHAANSVLLFVILRAMTGCLWRSAFVAAVFAVHPLHVESIAWITERKDALSGLFGLLTVWAYVSYARRPSVSRYLLVFAALALGLMAKPMLMTWPFLLLLLDYWPLGRLAAGSHPEGTRRGATQKVPDNSLSPCSVLRAPSSLLPIHSSPRPVSWLILEKLPLLLIAAASATITLMAQKSSGSVVPLATVSIAARLARAAPLYVAYLGKTVLPVNLAAAYPDPPLQGPLPVLGAVALLALLSFGAALGARRGQPWLIVGWLWYLGTLFPAVGLVQAGVQVMADRFVYLPQIGLCVAFAWGVSDFVSGHCHVAVGLFWKVRRYSPARRPIAILSSIFLSCLAVVAWRQAAYWRNSETLWARTLACTSPNGLAHYNLGKALQDKNRKGDAFEQYRLAIADKPGYALAYNNLGELLDERGDCDQAMEYYRKALEFDGNLPEAESNLGNDLRRKGDLRGATEHLQRAVELRSGYAEARYNLAMVMREQGDANTAVELCRTALGLNPRLAEAHVLLGEVAAGRGNHADAAEHYRQAGRLAVAAGNRGLASEMRRRLERYDRR